MSNGASEVYVLDTSTIIDLFKGRGRVAERVLAVRPHQIGLAAVVLFELEVGAEKSNRPEATRRQIHELERLVTLLPFCAEEARAAARIRCSLEAVGQAIGPFDALIAATALASRGVLVTHNTGEFGRVEGLRVEDWF
jgi:tRNA(fMet)-specific endonuclease VapC